jgi:hypothetical protein
MDSSPNSEFALHQHARIPKLLTAAAWRKIQPDMIKLMEGIKFDRFHTANQHVFRAAFMELKIVVETLGQTLNRGDRLFPRIADVCLFPEVREIMDVELGDLPTREELEAKLTPIFPKLVSDWVARLNAQLSGLITSHFSPPAGVNPLHLACARPKCSSCHFVGAYADMLSHGCLYKSNQYLHIRKPWISYETRVFTLFQSFWECSFAMGDIHAARYKKVIEACGKDPDRAMVEEMNELDAKLICLLCRNPEVMTWQVAVRHIVCY